MAIRKKLTKAEYKALRRYEREEERSRCCCFCCLCCFGIKLLIFIPITVICYYAYKFFCFISELVNMQVETRDDRYMDLIGDSHNISNGSLYSNTNTTFSEGEGGYKKFVYYVKQLWGYVGHLQKNITT